MSEPTQILEEPPVEGRPRPRGRRWLKIVAFVLLGLLGLGVLYVGVTFLQVWRASHADEARAVDAIVVLGAAQYDGRPSPVFEGRLERALELYRDGLAPVIVTTGSKQEGDRFTEGFTGFDYLRRRDVPEESILVVTDGRDTWESLTAASLVLGERDMDTVLLVSDPYHSMRVKQIAEDVGLEAFVAPTDASSSFRQLARETAAVAIGRIIGFRRVSSLS